MHGYRGYTIIPNPLETFIIKNSLRIGIIIVLKKYGQKKEIKLKAF